MAGKSTVPVAGPGPFSCPDNGLQNTTCSCVFQYPQALGKDPEGCHSCLCSLEGPGCAVLSVPEVTPLLTQTLGTPRSCLRAS